MIIKKYVEEYNNLLGLANSRKSKKESTKEAEEFSSRCRRDVFLLFGDGYEQDFGAPACGNVRASTRYTDRDLIIDNFHEIGDIGNRIASRLSKVGFFSSPNKDKITQVFLSPKGDVRTRNYSLSSPSDARQVMESVVRFVVSVHPKMKKDGSVLPVPNLPQYIACDNNPINELTVRYEPHIPAIVAVYLPIWSCVCNHLPVLNEVRTSTYCDARGNIIADFNYDEDLGILLWPKEGVRLIPKITSMEEAKKVFAPVEAMVDTINFDDKEGTGKSGYIAAMFGTVLRGMNNKNVSPIIYIGSEETESGKSTAMHMLAKMDNPDSAGTAALTYPERDPAQFRRELLSVLDSNKGFIEIANLTEDITKMPLIADYITSGKAEGKHTSDKSSKEIINNAVIGITSARSFASGEDFLSRTIPIMLKGKRSYSNHTKDVEDYDYGDLRLRVLRVAEFLLPLDAGSPKQFLRFVKWAKTALKCALLLGYEDTITESGVSGILAKRKDEKYKAIKKALVFEMTPGKPELASNILEILMAHSDALDAYIALSGTTGDIHIKSFGKFLALNHSKVGLKKILTAGKMSLKYILEGEPNPEDTGYKDKEEDIDLPKEEIDAETPQEQDNIATLTSPSEGVHGMGTSPQVDAVEAFKASTSITSMYETLGGDIKSEQKAGRESVYRCLFHVPDKNPSMSINEERGVFHCFSCGEGGDLITMIRKATGKSLREVLELPIDREKPRVVEKETPPVKFDVISYCKNVSSNDPKKTAQKLIDYRKAQLKTQKPIALSLGSFGYNESQNFLFGKVQKFNGERWEYTGVQRLFLDSGDKKCLGRIKGGGVLVSGSENATTYVLSEGIGTSIAVEEVVKDASFDETPLYGLKNYANFSCISAGGLASFKLPPHVTEVIIVEDNDEAGKTARADFFRIYSHLQSLLSVSFGEDKKKGYDLRDYYLEKTVSSC